MNAFEVQDANRVNVSLTPSFAEGLAQHLLETSPNKAFHAFAYQIRKDAEEIIGTPSNEVVKGY